MVSIEFCIDFYVFCVFFDIFLLFCFVWGLTSGHAIVHTSHFDALVEGEMDLPEHKTKNLTDVEKAIGKLIAENLVEDGATMQMGIGAIPDAVLADCTNHKDLGVHSEMFSDGVVDLYNLGLF